jgi:tetratricopeptide (TPR) repeat protein
MLDAAGMTRLAIQAKEYLMRFTPAAIALSLLAGVTSSIAISATGEELGPRASQLLAEGHARLTRGDINGAVDSYEAALVVQPGNPVVLVSLAEATRAQDMQGKALHYYRSALSSDPRNVLAIAGEGAALAEKGAVAKARRNLAQLQGICGTDCEATRKLAAVLNGAPARRVVHAEAVKPNPVVSEN